jgi:hypothetical protein
LTSEGNIDILKAEQAFRAAALAQGNHAFLSFLSELPEDPSICTECGKVMGSQGKRVKHVTTMLGDGELSRTYYECEHCHTHSFPKDEMLGMVGTSFTPGVKRATARLAALESFESTSSLLLELCGINICSKDTERISEAIGEIIQSKSSALIKDTMSDSPNIRILQDSVPVMYLEYDGTGIPVVKAETDGRAGKQADGSAKTREMKVGCIFTQHGVDEKDRPIRDKASTTYFASIEKADDFGSRVYTEAMLRGAGAAERIVILGDGAKWIWNIADLHFPKATQIVDLYHAKEHISKLLKDLTLDDDEFKVLKDWMYALLDEGDIPQLAALMSLLPAEKQNQRDNVSREIAYFTNNAHRMNYPEFKKQGLFVGSGVIEAGCKNVIGKRLKQSGMHWSVRGANSIAALRCNIISGQFDYSCLLAA